MSEQSYLETVNSYLSPDEMAEYLLSQNLPYRTVITKSEEILYFLHAVDKQVWGYRKYKKSKMANTMSIYNYDPVEICNVNSMPRAALRNKLSVQQYHALTYLFKEQYPHAFQPDTHYTAP